MTDRSRNGSRNGSRIRSKDYHSETPKHNQKLHNDSYSSNEGEVWESRDRSDSRNPRNDSRENKITALRKETFF